MWHYAIAVRCLGDEIFGDVNTEPVICDFIDSFALADVASVSSAPEGGTEEKAGVGIEMRSKVKKEIKVGNFENHGKVSGEFAGSNEANAPLAKMLNVSPGVWLDCGEGV